ncbi:hypothetical protein Moror_17480 [Moniliophthora roreri MCA 2997]|uniref:SLS1 C-terminal domain-containing protein n=2 Tax=Moniliophthora roreri TaxID=221103 RepID=V2XEM7_MONRO|nr:hypothetical protein Moror_17480 [Moniliophthora roreri MCA 2997]KAI3612543.1 hypothetical protein WG66_009865 [Moniliophthora roreri]
MWLASALRRQLCPQCRNFRPIRLYSIQAALYSPRELVLSHHNAEGTPEPSSSSSPSSTVSGAEQHSVTASKSRRKKAKGKGSFEPPPKNILEENKVEEYLAEIAASKDIVTLEDLYRLRPKQHAKPDSPEYEDDYSRLLDKIQQTFNRKQLAYFVETLLNISPPKHKMKSAYAVQIIEKAWGWPSLTETQKRRRDWSEVETEFFALNPAQSFLIMGKDGSDLLSLSMDYNVHVIFSAKPLGLRVEGLRGALEQLRSHVASLKEEVAGEFLVLPSDRPISSSLLQRISRLSGAFTEKFDAGKIWISYKHSNPRAAMVSKRLVTQASCKAIGAQEPSLLAYIPPGVPSDTPIPISVFPHTYAMYPFLSTRGIPWALDAKGAFRLRKVGEWLGLDPTENIQKTGGLALGRGSILDLTEREIDVRKILTQLLTLVAEGQQRSVTASFGHVLVASGQPSLVPPLKGSWPLAKFLTWMRDQSVKHIFNASLPPALLNAAPQNRSVRHRLVYRALPADETSQVAKLIKLEIAISLPRRANGGENANEVDQPSFQYKCSVETEAVMDIMLPNRPMDIRFSVYDSASLEDADWPNELRSYVKDVGSFLQYADPQAQQPETPLMFSFNNETYLLQSSVNVRQNKESLPVLGPVNTPLSATTESTLDLEVNEKTTVCQINCDDLTSDDEWWAFLKGCDYLTSHRTEALKRKFCLSTTDDF